MAHYDLYQALGLSRGADTASLVSQIDAMLSSQVATNPGGPEELQIARAILGDPSRREVYDQKLNDPLAPEINIVALRELAATNFGTPAPSSQPWQAPKSGSQSWSKMQTRLKPALASAGSSKGVIAVTAVATALIIALVVGLVSLVGHITSDERKVKGLANDFLQLRTTEETELWLAHNAFSPLRDELESELDIPDDYSGVDNTFGIRDPQAGEVIPFEPMLKAFFSFDEETMEAAYARDGVDAIYVVTVADRGGRDQTVRLVIIVDGGTAQLAVIDTDARELDDVFDDGTLEWWM